MKEEAPKSITQITACRQTVSDNGTNVVKSHNVRTMRANLFLDRGKLITMNTNPRFIYVRAHTHDFIELCYMREGQTTHIINGKKIILCKGEALILNQHATQEILPAGENDILMNFIILPQFFSKPLDMLVEDKTPLRGFILDCIAGRENTDGYLHFKTADVLSIQNLFKNLIFYFSENVPINIKAFTVGLLLLEFIRNSDKLVSENTEKSAVLQTLKYIEENYQNGTLADIAERLHYDLYWLSRKVKSKTGKTFTELLQEKRLSRAEHLLLNSNLKIDDIAASIGYNNMSYFRRIFEKKFGTSPKKYRNTHS